MRTVCLKYAIVTYIFLIMLVLSAYAVELKSSIDITKIGKGARPMALGGAYTALADDTFAIFTNPAGLGIQDRMSFTSMSTQILGCVDYRLIGGSYPTIYGNLAIGYVNATTPGGNRSYYDQTLGTTIEAGGIYYSNSIITLSYGLKLSDIIKNKNIILQNISIGASLKLFSQGFTGDILNSPSAKGSDIDLGILYRISDDLTVGTVMQNLTKSDDGELKWSTGENEEIASSTKLGVNYRISKNIRTTLDIDLLEGTAPIVLHSGIEWDVMKYLSLRAGLDQNYESISEGNIGVKTDISAGVGVSFDGFRFDYAYHGDNAIPDNATHYFSITYFGSPIERPKQQNEEDGFGNIDDLFKEEVKENKKDTKNENRTQSDEDYYNKLFNY